MVTVALIVELISTVLSLLCLPINIIFVYVILKESRRPTTPFASSFFRLCIHLSMADILMSIFATIFFKFPIFGVFPESFYEENWSVVPVAGVNYLGHSQAIGIIFIAVNRFTAVYFPVRHKQRWWRPQVIRSLMVIQWTIPLIFIIPLFFTEFNFVMDRSTGSVTFSSKDAVFHKVFSSSNTVVFLLPIFSVLAAMTRPEDAWMYRTLWFVVNDVLCASNAPILLALNKPIRRVYMKKIGLQPKENRTKGSLICHI
ncbi:unnamed protein product [Haemonchus placei]|uniref:G_PROTEIN_RECEP_F1_2 domain-containing protein n=1 Tax=Haemonchus placei TaxID=6290 RepID=A0A0N4WZP1_HAEPC|nr:unnamed protein product [Haemonchus placei]